ncbi:helix-turn-helix domain-containing protein [Flavobacterium quisquiliarum]|uniref:Helix-turn-helix domain-containing protein n=1 Tax=Flavobacterium quisquiliarum TaxID=1834436 RepID=A0ABV8WFY9_9FLAO|nr:helix-turn-helix domain-containing protein [Flavobacterium quisquiliarum]MBW1657561.1 helix-turn-helix domain-containing protein [Flavobacterium quisquiliarum]NWK99279.1 AraC family transcriptional regulator [Flavobacterium collinsii]
MIDILLSLFFFIATIAGLATSFMVLFSKKYFSKSFFLGMFLLSLAVVSIYNFYLSANMFKEFPDLFTITKSFIFLAAPCSFLYVRNILSPNNKNKKYDWVHFIPFGIYFILTLFVYIGSFTDSKIVDYVGSIIKNPFSILTLTIWLFYVFFQTMLILNYDLKKFNGNQFHRSKIINWIRVYNLMILFLFSALFVYHFLLRKIDAVDISCYFLISTVLFFTVGWLYFRPQIFHDEEEAFDFVSDNTLLVKSKEIKTNLPIPHELTTDKKEDYLLKLDYVLNAQKLFLKKDFVIRDLSDETGISVHLLSNLINSEFGLHFQDYVNLKRIEYFKEKINDPEWKDLSLEGMAWGSGFKSRTTCFRAFIKHTGKSPSEYFKTIRINPERTTTSTYYFK